MAGTTLGCATTPVFRPTSARSQAVRPAGLSIALDRGVRRRPAPACSAQAREGDGPLSPAYLATLGLLTPLLASDSALAAAESSNPLLVGKTVSLIHPAIMLFLFGTSVYTGWLGLQWREARTIPATVKELKAQLPKPDAEGTRPPSPVEGEIKDLEAKRKELLKNDPREKHNNFGSLLLGLGVLIALEGPVNTYLRAGKLFPGPHLYAGAAIVALWAGAASLVPAMKRGNDTARTLHITLNSLNLLLFAWQIPTGFDIVAKVWANVPWP